jgi:uncharacterized protein YndB with AHSA1/START domain
MRLRDLLVTLVFTGVLVASPLRAGELRSVTERTLDAPRADVWTLLTTKAGLQKWLSRDVTLDFRVGGRIETEEVRPRMSGTVTRMVLAYDPERLIALRPLLIPGTVSDRNVWESSWLVITLESAGERKTHIQVVGLVPTGYPASEGILKDLQESNRQMLEKLAAAAAVKPAGASAP